MCVLCVCVCCVLCDVFGCGHWCGVCGCVCVSGVLVCVCGVLVCVGVCVPYETAICLNPQNSLN